MVALEQVNVDTGIDTGVDTNVKNYKETKKLADSNRIDYNLNKVDEQKFQEFKEMTDYIKENGGKYEEEYKNIVKKVIKPFEDQIQHILDKNNDKMVSKNLDSMSDDEVANEADEIMKNQPEELKKQQELMKKINGNGSPKEIQQLNEIVSENMVDVQNFWKKIGGGAIEK